MRESDRNKPHLTTDTKHNQIKTYDAKQFWKLVIKRLKKAVASSQFVKNLFNNREDLVDSFTADNFRFQSLQLRSGTWEIFNEISYYRQHSRKPVPIVAAIDFSIVDIDIANE